MLTPSNSFLSELLSIRVISINWSTSHLRLPISSHLFLLRFVWKSDTPKIQRPIIFVPIKTAIWGCTSIFRKKTTTLWHISLWCRRAALEQQAAQGSQSFAGSRYLFGVGQSILQKGARCGIFGLETKSSNKKRRENTNCGCKKR